MELDVKKTLEYVDKIIIDHECGESNCFNCPVKKACWFLIDFSRQLELMLDKQSHL